MEVHLVADTNLFFECKALEQLPWHELGYERVVILLTKPVSDEIDKHKKGTGRTRDRALEIFGRVREMLRISVQEIEIKQSAPTVILRRMTNVSVSDELKTSLDYTKTDEKLIGIVATLSSLAAGYDVKLFTDDTGPAMMADGLNVPYLMIDESWRRPPAETTEAKKIKELEQDLAMYRAQEPRISISLCEPAVQSNAVMVTRKVATPLTPIEVEEVITELQLKHPLKADFTPPRPSRKNHPSGGFTDTEYSAPTDEQIAEYQNALYPQWVGQCRTILGKFHEGRDDNESEVVLRWSMSNDGTRPASQVLVEFEAHGPLVLQRIEVAEDEEDSAQGDSTTSEAAAAPVSRFPSPPKPPPFQEHTSHTPPPAGTPRAQGLDLMARAGIAWPHEQFKNLDHVSKILGIGVHDPLFDAYKNVLSRMDDAGLTGFSALHDPSMAKIMAAANSRPFESLMGSTRESLKLASLLRPEPHDPEKFRYNWPKGKLVKKGALTCNLWRHHAGKEIFEFRVLFRKEGDVRGMVQCTVHAENLTKPEQARVTVSRTIEGKSMLELARGMVETCR